MFIVKFIYFMCYIAIWMHIYIVILQGYPIQPMERKWIVLIGPPAVGKTTLSKNLVKIICTKGTVKIYSFDQEFPKCNFRSKEYRIELLDRIKADMSEWIIVDDTCHLKSIQKQYLKVSEEFKEIKVIFLYISAKIDQVSILKKRNESRNSVVTDREIDRMVNILNLSSSHLLNKIEYNFEEIPEKVDQILTSIMSKFATYKRRNLLSVICNDVKSDTNYLNLLNLALIKEINKVFKESKFEFDGKKIARAKKEFLRLQNPTKLADIEGIVLQFNRDFLGTE